MKALYQAKKDLAAKLVIGVLIAFFVFFGWRDEILPAFSKNIVSLHILASIIYPILLTPFITFPFLFINLGKSIRKNRMDRKTNRFYRFENLPFKSAALFLGSIAIVILFCDLTKLSAREKIKGFLDGVFAEDLRISVNEQLVENPTKVIAELKKIAPLTPHHSHATEKIRIQIMSHNKTLRIELGRDSSSAQEYWVFYPEYRYTSKNDVGRIITDIFDDY